MSGVQTAKRRQAELPPPPLPAPPTFVTTPAPAKPVRRLTGADMDRHLPWLVPMMVEDYGYRSDTVLRWLRSWESDNQFSLVCTDDGVGLAMMDLEPLGGAKVVKEIFLYIRTNEGKPEGVQIYQHWCQWGKMSGASRFRFYHSANTPTHDLRAVFPKMAHDRVWFVDL